jgi:sugar lactone lactonase YvrE
MSARRLLAAFGLVAVAGTLSGCDRLDGRAMLMMVEPGYRAELLLTERHGIASPDGLLWENGRLLIADEGGSAVRAWTAADGRLQTLAGAEHGLKSPEDLARGPDGALYVTDDDAGGLWRIGPEGGARQVVSGADLASTEGLAAAPSGTLLIGGGNSGRIVSLHPDGRAERLPLRIAKPESMAHDASGNLYIADNDEDVLYLLTPDGRLQRPIAGREGFSPESLAIAGGDLLITDSHHGRLYRYSPEQGLRTVAVLAGELANIQGIAVDEGGNIYLSVQSDLKGRRGFILRLARQ